jgi:hypothetical protein
MKPALHKLILLHLLLLTGVIACNQNKSNVTPNDPLYGRWQLIETRQVNQAIFYPDQARPTIITFKRSGEYIYEYDGRVSVCCQPNRFSQQKDRLTLSTVYTGPSPAECALVYCAQYDPNWIVDTLTTQRLVLTRGEKVQDVYRAVP